MAVMGSEGLGGVVADSCRSETADMDRFVPRDDGFFVLVDGGQVKGHWRWRSSKRSLAMAVK
jgi:hypothetical protein